MIRTLSVVAGLALAAGATQAAVMQLDINGIEVSAAGGFDGVTHTGTLTITMATEGTILDVLIDGQSEGDAGLSNVMGEIELVNGQVMGGFLNVFDGQGDLYAAAIGQAGRVNTQAGQGFRIDGLTFAGVFDAARGDEGLTFAGVNVFDIFGPNAFNESLEGSFLLFAFSPDDNGFDGRADIDIFIVPTPGTVALAGLAGIAVLRRKRN